MKKAQAWAADWALFSIGLVSDGAACAAEQASGVPGAAAVLTQQSDLGG